MSHAPSEQHHRNCRPLSGADAVAGRYGARNRAFRPRHSDAANPQAGASCSVVAANDRALAQLYPFNPLGATAGRFFFVGVPGIGKTLAIAKLAAHARTRGCAVRLVTCDGTRRASVEQLRHFAATLGIEIEIVADVAALSARPGRRGVHRRKPGRAPSAREALDSKPSALRYQVRAFDADRTTAPGGRLKAES
ncbi:MAG: hypothetical protein KGQ82_01100 [Alphaproteobacteria bacterium]|nr:hypothetical protein [Alphaproteobacteria bacterium]